MSIKAIDQKSLQFKKIFINVGGACLFRALCWGENIINDVSQDEDKDHGGIRSQIVNHIKQNKVGFEKDLKNNFYNFINSLDAGISIQGISAEFKAKLEAIRSQDEQTIEGYLQTQWADDYLAHMNENDAWGGPAELRAAAEVMEANLEVHDSEDYSKITTYGDAEGSNTIHLEFDGSHYNLLIPND